MKRLRRFLAFLRAPMIRTGLHSVTRDGVTRECWQRWDWTWGLALPELEEDYYDGWYTRVGLIVGTLGHSWDTNYHAKHREAALRKEETTNQ